MPIVLVVGIAELRVSSGQVTSHLLKPFKERFALYLVHDLMNQPVEDSVKPFKGLSLSF